MRKQTCLNELMPHSRLFINIHPPPYRERERPYATIPSQRYSYRTGCGSGILGGMWVVYGNLPWLIIYSWSSYLLLPNLIHSLTPPSWTCTYLPLLLSFSLFLSGAVVVCVYYPIWKGQRSPVNQTWRNFGWRTGGKGIFLKIKIKIPREEPMAQIQESIYN